MTLEGKNILEDVTLRVNHSELVFLVGAPSSGKSVILKLLCHELQPQHGQILVDDRNVTRLHPSKLPAFRRRLGIVPQELRLPRRTVEGALAFKLGSLGFEQDDIDTLTEEILDTVGMRDMSETLVTELDRAQQKIFALALAACHNPVLILIDEPFAGLKYEEGHRVLECLQAVHERKRVAMLVATREREWAVRSGARIVYLWAGRTYDEAPVTEL